MTRDEAKKLADLEQPRILKETEEARKKILSYLLAEIESYAKSGRYKLVINLSEFEQEELKKLGYKVEPSKSFTNGNYFISWD